MSLSSEWAAKKALIVQQIQSRGVRAANAIRNHVYPVMRASGGGRVYGGHTASLPGQPPAIRSGHYAGSFRPNVENTSDGVIAKSESDCFYGGFLEGGTSKMAARPHVDRIRDDALPEVEAIFAEPYNV